MALHAGARERLAIVGVGGRHPHLPWRAAAVAPAEDDERGEREGLGFVLRGDVAGEFAMLCMPTLPRLFKRRRARMSGASASLGKPSGLLRKSRERD